VSFSTTSKSLGFLKVMVTRLTAGEPELLERTSKKCHQILAEIKEMLMPAGVDREITGYLDAGGA
jgi:hypothetical protein